MTKIMLICVLIGIFTYSAQASPSSPLSLQQGYSQESVVVEITKLITSIIYEFIAYFSKSATQKCPLILTQAKELVSSAESLGPHLFQDSLNTLVRVKDNCLTLEFFSCYKKQIEFVYNQSFLGQDYDSFKKAFKNLLEAIGNCGKLFV